MRRYLPLLPTALTLSATLALIFHGPVAQLAHYHHFADQRGLAGIANAGDVLSNIPFALVGIWGLLRLGAARENAAVARGWAGYMLFFAALVLTAIGSSWYHLAPDNTRLIFDRLPIALACAGLLAAVQAETTRLRSSVFSTVMLAAAAVTSVGWWAWTDHILVGDLRFYLLLQAGPIVLIPLWQWIYRAPKSDRIAFALAIGCYLLAKATELADHQILATLGTLSGHTLKHLLAALGAAIVTWQVTRRVTWRLPEGSIDYVMSFAWVHRTQPESTVPRRTLVALGRIALAIVLSLGAGVNGFICGFVVGIVFEIVFVIWPAPTLYNFILNNYERVREAAPYVVAIAALGLALDLAVATFRPATTSHWRAWLIALLVSGYVRWLLESAPFWHVLIKMA